MKLNKMILPVMIALVALTATTGCKKSNPKTTLITGRQIVGPGDSQNMDTKPFDPNAGNPNSNSGDVGFKPGSLAQNQNWTIEQVDQDRGALADQTVHFAFDSAAILSKEENKLVIVAEKLKSDSAALLIIEGHCDERGTEEYNRALGERRALALREALSRAGIDGNRIRTLSFGKDKPADQVTTKPRGTRIAAANSSCATSKLALDPLI
jgi:peptidoglycan-associated lipoprotein